jgi:hypothetical protein
MRNSAQPISKAEAKVFVISAIALSATVANATFWFGVFGRIFFTHILYIWIAATAALLASFFIPRLETPLLILPWQGRFLLALPTCWLVLAALVDVDSYQPDSPATWALWILTLVSALVTFPYLLYVIILAVVPDIDRLTHPKLIGALLGILAVMGTAGYALGTHHDLFLTCENFKAGGHDIPENCRAAGDAVPK